MTTPDVPSPWWADPHDAAPNPDGCVGCLLLDPDMTPHENMEEAYRLGLVYGHAGPLGVRTEEEHDDERTESARRMVGRSARRDNRDQPNA